MIAAAGIAAMPALAQDQQTEGTPPAEQAEPAPAPDSTTGTPTDESKDDADDSNTAPTTDTTDDSSAQPAPAPEPARSEEHTSELQSLMRNSYAVFCLKKKTSHHEHSQYSIRHT